LLRYGKQKGISGITFTNLKQYGLEKKIFVICGAVVLSVPIEVEIPIASMVVQDRWLILILIVAILNTNMPTNQLNFTRNFSA
jgi:hypothetical protein